jgi:CRISPR-associated protein Csm3
LKKIFYHEITGIIHCRSGLRIGGSDELLQIGGTDLTCIKHPVTLKPYIPGSSIKGKVRSELEQRLGKFGGSGNEPCGCASQDCLICRVFGPHKKPNHDLGPTRIVVRDAQLTSEVNFERKASTAIDRKTGTALRGALRTEERVVADSEFSFRVGIQVWDIDQDVKHGDKTGGDALVELVKEGLRALQQTGLGSGVSKGSGEIEFRDLKLDGQPFTLTGSP